MIFAAFAVPVAAFIAWAVWAMSRPIPHHPIRFDEEA